MRSELDEGFKQPHPVSAVSRMRIGVPREVVPGERRVALVPETVQKLTKAGNEVVVERGAGVEAAFVDSAYEQAGARIVDDAFDAELIAKVQKPTADEVAKLKQGQVLVAFLQPLIDPKLAGTLAERGAASRPGGRGVRPPARGEGAGAEPRRQVPRDRPGRVRGGRGRLREGALRGGP